MYFIRQKGLGLLKKLMSVISSSTTLSPPLPSSSSSLPPVVVILGSTASGKSKLAIDLALKYGGEVISADSMQVYDGLDILTNKVTEEEMKGVPHYMIGVVNRTVKFDVVHFRDQALPLVETIRSSGKIPFVVGGTNYYIESLLWEVLISRGRDKSPQPCTRTKRKVEDANQNEIYSSQESGDQEKSNSNLIIDIFQSQSGAVEDYDSYPWSNEDLHAALKLVDPERANRLHPNDRRKVYRSLQVRFQTGTKHSTLIAQQCSDAGKSSVFIEELPSKALGGPLRFSETICFWIQVDKEILLKRIEDRVDNMVQLGLRTELDTYMDAIRETDGGMNYEEGILQSIGFKEFHSYLQLDPNDRYSEEGDKLFQDGLERLKIVTRQYARQQLKWIRQRFLLPERRQVPPVYRLDGNMVDSERWIRNVYSPATEMLDAYLENRLSDGILTERRVIGETKVEDDLVARVCEICDNRMFIGILQWEAHMSSHRHRKMLKKKSLISSKACDSDSEKVEHVKQSEVLQN